MTKQQIANEIHARCADMTKWMKIADRAGLESKIYTANVFTSHFHNAFWVEIRDKLDAHKKYPERVSTEK